MPALIMRFLEAVAYVIIVILNRIVSSLTAYITNAWKKTWKSSKQIPGPWGLPFVGYLPFLGVRHKTFMNLVGRYGPLFTLRLGNKKVILLSDYKIILKAFRQMEFTGRPSTPFMSILGGLGIINSEGTLWKKQRRFLHMIILGHFDVTFGGLQTAKKELEKKIMIEVNELIYHLYESGGMAIDPRALLTLTVANLICGITMSTRFKLGEARFTRLNFLIEEGMRLFGENHYGEYISLYNHLPGKAASRQRLIRNRQEMFHFYDPIIKEHRETLDLSSPRDCIDCYLIAMDKANKEGKAEELYQGKDHELQLKQTLNDIFSAATDSIKSSLLWKLVFMLRNPEVKRKVQEELDSVVQNGQLPQINDMKSLPYTQATIAECMRLASVVPLATTHTVTKNVWLEDYFIPAGSDVISLINFVHMDPSLWKNPGAFEAARFIDSDGTFFTPPYLMPFGVGRRMCLGNVLARIEMFLIFATLMHQFDIQMEEGEAPPSLEGTVGATIAPKPFRMRFVPRSTTETVSLGRKHVEPPD